ncbi:hypothetical protein C8E03_10416 [Lachnotalea glycerini]|uniref:Uncharacterized protein n=1 Tax=Lachnotalea glycerini TaxID=1763509 RepID=A0A255I244_9FIRM|nr:hypothetical protein [Lachnotalea glycerini]PXV91009.1 hypothetical protein C8E03_10416 [Lachnotalea glycerini]RDY30108.1 hypothetical protein CG710_016355 [Lachnotalea glycerini]
MKKGLDLYFLIELENYVTNGVPLVLEGHASTPIQIYEALRECNDYMSDYVGNEKGELKEIRFDKVNYI